MLWLYSLLFFRIQSWCSNHGEAHSQEFYKRGYMGVWSVCMHAWACKTKACSPRKVFEIRYSEIVSEAILGQKQSYSSYMVRWVLHPLFGSPCMHLLSQLTSNFHERIKLAEQQVGWCHQNFRAPEIMIYLLTYVCMSLHCSGVNSLNTRSAGCWSSTCEQIHIAKTRDPLVNHFQTVGHLKWTVKR